MNHPLTVSERIVRYVREYGLEITVFIKAIWRILKAVLGWNAKDYDEYLSLYRRSDWKETRSTCKKQSQYYDYEFGYWEIEEDLEGAEGPPHIIVYAGDSLVDEDVEPYVVCFKSTETIYDLYNLDKTAWRSTLRAVHKAIEVCD